MKYFTFLILTIILLFSHVTLASPSNLIGVWKSAKHAGLLQTIEFRKDGAYIFCDGKWIQENGKTLQKVQLNQYKIGGLDYFLVNGVIVDQFMARKYNDEAVKFVLKEGRLKLTDIFGRAKTYVRLNEKEFNEYNNTLKMFGNGIGLSNIQRQKLILSKSKVRQDKQKQINIQRAKQRIDKAKSSLIQEVCNHTAKMYSYTGEKQSESCFSTIVNDLKKGIRSTYELEDNVATLKLINERLSLETELSTRVNTKFGNEQAKLLLSKNMTDDVELNDSIQWRSDIRRLKKQLVEAKKGNKSIDEIVLGINAIKTAEALKKAMESVHLHAPKDQAYLYYHYYTHAQNIGTCQILPDKIKYPTSGAIWSSNRKTALLDTNKCISQLRKIAKGWLTEGELLKSADILYLRAVISDEEWKGLSNKKYYPNLVRTTVNYLEKAALYGHSKAKEILRVRKTLMSGG